MARRQRFSAPVAREIAERARNAIGEPCCEKCGAVGVPLELHHLKMDAAVPDHVKKRKPLTAADGAMWCEECHDPETARQRKLLAKIERQEGVYWRPRKESTLRSGNTLPGAKPQRRATTPPSKTCNGPTALERRMGITEDA
jgi:hypothetical protein